MDPAAYVGFSFTPAVYQRGVTGTYLGYPATQPDGEEKENLGRI